MPKITFGDNPLDHSSKLRGDIEWQKNALQSDKSKFMIFHEDRPLIKTDPTNRDNPKIYWLTYQDIKYLLDQKVITIFLGLIGENIYYAIDLKEKNNEPEKLESNLSNAKFIDLRSIAPMINNKSAAVIAQAKSIFEWNKSVIYCTKCKGVELEVLESGYKKKCSQCEKEYFPRVDPVVIMLPFHENKCLLGRQKIFPPNMYSALAGFLEPGETIESAVIREVKEEVNLNTENVIYKFSQPWPFPSQLMIGCLAEVDSFDHKADEDEIEDSIWLDKEDLTAIFVGKHQKRIWIPPPMAIAHQLILEWMHKN
jgi:NAD+ diphosphatase